MARADALEAQTGLGGMAWALRDLFRVRYMSPLSRVCAEVLEETRELRRAALRGDDPEVLEGAAMVEERDLSDHALLLGRPVVASAGAASLVGWVRRCRRPKLVFAELDPFFRNARGGGYEALQFLASYGYTVRWAMMGASEVGAPHKRTRLWLLAALPDAADLVSRAASASPEAEWLGLLADPAREPERMEPDSPERRRLCHCLSCSCVPHAARWAFVELVRWMEDGACGAKPQRDPPRSALPSAGGACECCGWWAADAPLPVGRPAPKLALCFDPALYRAGWEARLASPPLRSPMSASEWATPRHMNYCAGQTLTAQSVRELPSQVRWETGSGDQRCREGQVSVPFLCWMMGYPEHLVCWAGDSGAPGV